MVVEIWIVWMLGITIKGSYTLTGRHKYLSTRACPRTVTVHPCIVLLCWTQDRFRSGFVWVAFGPSSRNRSLCPSRFKGRSCFRPAFLFQFPERKMCRFQYPYPRELSSIINVAFGLIRWFIKYPGK